MSDHQVQALPYEIVKEILLQLPVKSLLRFKCVCKPWLALISDTKFIKSHLRINRSTKKHQDDPSSRALLMLSSASLLQSLQVQVVLNTTSINDPSATEAEAAGVLALSSGDTSSTTTRVVEEAHEYLAVHVSHRPSVKDIKIVGSCNGLICLVVDSQDMMIYNPSTRQAQRVPPLTLITSKDYFYGFGYDSYNDDYKIVRATSSSKGGIFATQLDIFSLKTNTWRAATKTIPNCYFLSNVVGTLLNGALHWVVRRLGKSTSIADDHDDYDDERPFSIVSFDLTKETYRQVPLPVDGDKSFSFYGLGVLVGRLSMLHSPNNGSDYQVWLMNEYSSKASWTIFTTIPQKMDAEYLGLMSLLCILNNGEILILLHQRKLIIYNPADTGFRTVCSGDIHSSQLALYMESSFSPPSN